MISIVRLTYLGRASFDLEFNDGSSGVFDLRHYLNGKAGPLLDPLNDESFVARAFVEGGGMAWPHGLELSPQRIFENCIRKQEVA